MKSNQSTTILAVDDHEYNVDVIEGFLMEDGYNLLKAYNGADALKMVERHEIDLILLDVNMPQMDGFEVCKILKANPSTKDIPVIFLTALTDIDSIAQAFQMGGSDYLQKPYCGLELKIRIRTHLNNKFYLEEIKSKQAKLAQLAATDNLTKLYNSIYFDSKIKLAQQEEKRFAIIYVKVNNLEQVNRVYGFDSSNKIIKHYAKVLKNIIPPEMVLARLYGASFGILLNDYDENDLRVMSKKIRSELTQIDDLKDTVHFNMVIYRNVSKLLIPEIYKKIIAAVESL
ncbi:MAG: response regulator [Sulfuricurvum sp.]